MKTDVCIVGGGPAGMVLALQLARQGVNLILLESARSYERSFRGESMQPDTVGIFHELGVAEALLKHGCLETHRLEVYERGERLLTVDYSDSKYRHKYVMDIPQPPLLEALCEKVAKFPNAQVLRGVACTGLVERGGRIVGAQYRSQGAEGEIEARLVVGADGRFSRVRDWARIPYKKQGTRRDVLWFKIPTPEGWSNHTARILLNGPNHLILLPTFPDLFRAGVNIPRKGYLELKSRGIESFYKLIDAIDPDFGRHVRRHITAWDDITLLDIFTARVPKWWRDGLVLIGDAAHTVTPLLGQGVNLGIQDAMDLAPMLARALRDNTLDGDLLAEFQARREPDIAFVANLQRRQEQLLCSRSPMMHMVRRMNYKALDKLRFLQRRVMDRISYKRQRLLQMKA